MPTCNNDISVPTTNNSPLPCGGTQIFDQCVIRESAISYLSLPADSNMGEIIDAIIASLQDARTRLATAEATITAQATLIEELDERITELETP